MNSNGKKSDYEALHRSSRDNEITAWLEYFRGYCFASCRNTTLRMIDFLIQKPQLMTAHG